MDIKFENRKVMLTETILRDAHQSQAATRMRIDEMLPRIFPQRRLHNDDNQASFDHAKAFEWAF